METRSIDLTANQISFIIDMMWDIDPNLCQRIAARNDMNDIQLHDQLQQSLLNYHE